MKETPQFQYISLHLYGIIPSQTLFKFIYSNEVVLNYQRVRHGLVYGKPTNSMLLQLCHIETILQSISDYRYHILCHIITFYNDPQIRELIKILVAISLEQFNEDGTVVPLNLRLKLFLIGVEDNLDKHALSTTGREGFHGTTVSLFQQPTKGQNIWRNNYQLRSFVQLDHAFPKIG